MTDGSGRESVLLDRTDPLGHARAFPSPTEDPQVYRHEYLTEGRTWTSPRCARGACAKPMRMSATTYLVILVTLLVMSPATGGSDWKAGNETLWAAP